MFDCADRILMTSVVFGVGIVALPLDAGVFLA